MFKEVLEEIALALEAKRIDYMLIGGQAVLLYGEPRLTQDVDITIGAGPERLPEIQEMVKKLGFQVLVPNPSEFVQKTMVLPVQDTKSKIRIDIIFSFSPYEQQAMKRVRKIQMGKALVRFASPEDLIIHKIISGRPRDMEDVKGVLIKNSDIDRSYILDWLKQFEESLKKTFVKLFEQLWKLSKTPKGK